MTPYDYNKGNNPHKGKKILVNQAKHLATKRRCKIQKILLDKTNKKIGYIFKSRYGQPFIFVGRSTPPMGTIVSIHRILINRAIKKHYPIVMHIPDKEYHIYNAELCDQLSPADNPRFKEWMVNFEYEIGEQWPNTKRLDVIWKTMYTPSDNSHKLSNYT